MPIYEYSCDDCKKTFSVLRLSTAPAETVCTVCGSKNVRKLMSAFCCSDSGSGGGSAGGGFGSGGGGG